jgi:UDP-glucose 4-epimerase
VDAALKGDDVTVTGDGSQTRCFTHVADVVEALVKLIDTPAAVGQVYNVGSDGEISINDLAAKVIAACGSSSKIKHVSYEAFYGRAFDDMMRRVPQLQKIREAIGYAPRRNLDEIIRSVVEDRRSVSAPGATPIAIR